MVFNQPPSKRVDSLILSVGGIENSTRGITLEVPELVSHQRATPNQAGRRNRCLPNRTCPQKIHRTFPVNYMGGQRFFLDDGRLEDLLKNKSDFSWRCGTTLQKCSNFHTLARMPPSTTEDSLARGYSSYPFRWECCLSWQFRLQMMAACPIRANARPTDGEIVDEIIMQSWVRIS